MLPSPATRVAIYALLGVALRASAALAAAPPPSPSGQTPLGRVALPGGRAERLRSLGPLPASSLDRAVASVARLGADLGLRGRARRVIYPMGNADVKTPLTLFGARGETMRELVIADLTPFGSARQVARLHGKRALRDAYARVLDGDYIDLQDFSTTVGVVGPALLWELEAMGARDVRVTHLDAHGRALRTGSRSRDRGTIARARWGWERAAEARDPALYDPAARDVVRVTFLLGGVKRSVLYVQQDLLAPDAVAPVLARELARGFDAWIEKAPMGVTRTGEYQRLRANALRGLAPGGLVLSDQELAGQGLEGRVTGKIATSSAYGYGRGVFVSVASDDPLAPRVVPAPGPARARPAE